MPSPGPCDEVAAPTTVMCQMLKSPTPARSDGMGRQVSLSRVDGTPAGIVTAEAGNWVGKALSAPGHA